MNFATQPALAPGGERIPAVPALGSTRADRKPAAVAAPEQNCVEPGRGAVQGSAVDFRSHADTWLAAWAARDLNAIMDCYADNVDFSAPTVTRRWGRPDGRLHGKAELRRHFELGLQLAPDLTFTEEALLTSPGGYALLYRRENGNRVLDVVELDEHGQAAQVRAFYRDIQQ